MQGPQIRKLNSHVWGDFIISHSRLRNKCSITGHLCSVAQLSLICSPVNARTGLETKVYDAIWLHALVEKAPVFCWPRNLDECTATWHEHWPLQASTHDTNHNTRTDCYLYLKYKPNNHWNCIIVDQKRIIKKPLYEQWGPQKKTDV